MESTPTTEELREFKTEIEGRPVQAAVQIDEMVAAIEVDKAECSAINRHGLWLGVEKILPCTPRPKRRFLRQKQRIHLCRVLPCLRACSVAEFR